MLISDSKKTVNNIDNQYGSLISWLCKHLWLFTIVMFFISFAIRLYLSFWTGPVVTQLGYPDELRFLHIARSLAESGQILVRGIESTYQKILYPLVISPAFILSDNQITQVNIIRIINCLLVSSTLFPAHLLANKLTNNKLITLLTLIITITLPDFKYSAGIFSEVLFLPLVIWIFYIAYCAIAEHRRHKKMMLYGLFGFVSYLAYLTKEIAAAFVIVMSLLLIFDVLKNRKMMKDNIFFVLVMTATFFTLFFVMKLTLFEGLGNTYVTETHNQISLSVLSSPDIILYLLYSFLVLFTGTVLSFYVAPVFFTLIGYTSMNHENKKIYLFSVLSTFVIIGAIAYTISIREDFLIQPMPRLHMRFTTPLLIPFIIQCLDILFSTESLKQKRTAKLTPVSKLDKSIAISFPYIIALFFIMVLLIFTSTEKSVYGMDGATLRSLFTIVTIVLYAGTSPVNVLFLLHNLILLVLTSYGSFTIVMKKSKTAIIIFLVTTLLVINAYDNFISYTDIRISKTRDFTQAYFTGLSDSHFELAFNTDGLNFSYGIVESLISVNNQISYIDDNIIVFVPGDFVSYTDTYLNPKAFPVIPFEFYEIAIANGGWVRIEEQPLTESNRFLNRVLGIDSWKRGFFSAEYIITITDGHPFLNVEAVYENGPFVILRNLNPDVVYIAME